MTDIEAWRRVDQLWNQHGLDKSATMGLDLARPFMENYIKEIKNVDSVDEGLLMHIFNEIDEDGNQTLDRQEMFEFVKKKDFKEPQTPAPLERT